MKTKLYLSIALLAVIMPVRAGETALDVTHADGSLTTQLAFEGKQFSGRYLMEHGLEIPYTNNVDYHKLNAWAS